jgi:NitT/TauT family transport system ATP-binding protein
MRSPTLPPQSHLNDAFPAPTRVVGAAIVAREVTKQFDTGVIAIDRLSLDIPAGQFVAMIGPSGCGKSTLLRMIAGLDRPTSGSLAVDADGDVAFVFQDAHLLPWRTVLHNAALPLELRGVARRARLARAAHELERVGLTDAMNRYPAQLSGGMRMRVSLARAMVMQPRLLLLDEPFAALDEITRQHLDEQLRALWLAAGMTVVFVTHSIVEATYLADRAVVFSARPARIVLDHPISDLPPDRPAAVRGEATFARQMRGLYEALERGGQT